MSGQDTGYEEVCVNCGDGLVAQVNWNIGDVMGDIRYCTKEQCQAAKPVLINSKPTAKRRKKREADPGLSQTLRPRNDFIKDAPDVNKVAMFTNMIADPRMLNERGVPKYSKIFKEYGVNSFANGLECAEMAAAQYPNEIDGRGCPSKQSVNSVRNHCKRLTKRFKGNLELHSTRGAHEKTNKRIWRWHINKEPDDVKKQVDDMLKIAGNISLSAKEREKNFTGKTYEERMVKVDLLDQFFDTQ
jgi:hypothetical protein